MIPNETAEIQQCGAAFPAKSETRIKPLYCSFDTSYRFLSHFIFGIMSASICSWIPRTWVSSCFAGKKTSRTGKENLLLSFKILRLARLFAFSSLLLSFNHFDLDKPPFESYHGCISLQVSRVLCSKSGLTDSLPFLRNAQLTI